MIGILCVILLASILGLVLLLADPAPDMSDREPEPLVLIFRVIFRSIAACIGGYITAWLAPARRFPNAIAVAGFFLLVSLGVTAIQTIPEPLWYTVAILALPFALTILGAVGQQQYPVGRAR